MKKKFVNYQKKKVYKIGVVGTQMRYCNMLMIYLMEMIDPYIC